MNEEGIFDKQELLKPENMLLLYARGAFPMADEKGDIDWYMPEIRTIIPIQNFNYPKSLRKYLEKKEFTYRIDDNVMNIIEHCAARKDTWISDELIEAYFGLYKLGHVHSVEVFEKNKLIGGLYGVVFRGAFFGESMFSIKSQASKAALIKLLTHLQNKKFTLLDVQFITDHLKMFGAKEITFEEYQKLQREAYSAEVKF
jgi:leucyl/phenylalanyl-tRNA--protein transferase